MLPHAKFPLAMKAVQARTLFLVGLFLFLFATAQVSYAQESGFHLLDKIEGGFSGKAAAWGSIVRIYANRLFWLLAVIDFSFMCATFVLDRKEIEDLFSSLVRKIMTLGFFWFVLKTSNDWIPQILGSFIKIGKEASGATATTPDSIAVTGYDSAMAAFQAMSELGITEKIGAVMPTVVMALLIFMAFLWVAVQLLVATIETSIAVGAGIILLGFGGSKWTTDMASKYMQYSIATGLKLMLLYLIVGMGQTLFDDIHIVGGDKYLESVMVATGSALTYAFLATKIPAMAGAMMSGSPSLSAGDMAGAMIGAAAAVTGLGAAGMAAGKAGMGAASGGAAAATGVGDALKAGVASGQDFGKSGAGLAAHALGEVGKHGMGLANAGIGDMLKGGASSFQSRVADSAGGKVATSIQAGRGGSMAGVAAPAGAASGGGSGQQGAGSTGASSTPAAPSAQSGSTNVGDLAPSSPGADSSASAGGNAASATGTDLSEGEEPRVPSGAQSLGSSAGSDVRNGPSEQARTPTGEGMTGNSAGDGGATASTGGSHPQSSSGRSQSLSTASSAPAVSGAGAPSQSQAASQSVPTSSAPASTSPVATGGSGGGGGSTSPATPGASQPSSAASPSTSAFGGGLPVVPQTPGAASPQSNGAGAPMSSPSGEGSGGQAASPAPAGTSVGAAEKLPESSGGDASTGAVTGGNEKPKAGRQQGAEPPKPLHERLKGLQGYVPDDAAHSATFHIDMKHSE